MINGIGEFNEYGTRLTSEGMSFTFSTEGRLPCAIMLYNKSNYQLLEEIVIEDEYRIGNVYSVVIAPLISLVLPRSWTSAPAINKSLFLLPKW